MGYGFIFQFTSQYFGLEVYNCSSHLKYYMNSILHLRQSL